MITFSNLFYRIRFFFDQNQISFYEGHMTIELIKHKFIFQIHLSQ